MDIKTKGLQLFRILEIIKEIPDKLYSGAIVNYPPNNERRNKDVMRKLLVEVRQLHQLLQVNKDFKKPDEALLAYDIAHHIGLSLQEEYELLNLLEERQRLEYLKRHLAKAIPMLNTMEQLKEKIQLNGHFKNLSGFDLDK
jgi:ATP-dependent Lon protease